MLFIIHTSSELYCDFNFWCADIVDGNLKAIMRLILALAAHYKPSSVKQASQQHGQGSPMGAQSTPGTPASGTPSRKTPRQPSFAAMAANAAAAIHDARKEAAGAGGSLRRYKESTPHRAGYGWCLLFFLVFF